MSTETKAIVAYDESLAKLDIRVGRVIEVDLETRTHKPTYKMVVDFGKYGKRVSYGRFTQHPIERVKNRLVLGVLNFESGQMGPATSAEYLRIIDSLSIQGAEAVILGCTEIGMLVLRVWDISVHRVWSPLSGIGFEVQQLIILGYYEYKKV